MVTGFEGHFWVMKRAPKNFPGNVGDGGWGKGGEEGINFAIISYSMLNIIGLININFELQHTINVFDHIFFKKHRPKVKFICFMDIYLLKGTFLKNCRLFSEQHFSRRQTSLCHRIEGTYCVF